MSHACHVHFHGQLSPERLEMPISGKPLTVGLAPVSQVTFSGLVQGEAARAAPLQGQCAAPLGTKPAPGCLTHSEPLRRQPLPKC